MFDFINPEPTLLETVGSSLFFFVLFAATFIVLATVVFLAVKAWVKLKGKASGKKPCVVTNPDGTTTKTTYTATELK